MQSHIDALEPGMSEPAEEAGRHSLMSPSREVQLKGVVSGMLLLLLGCTVMLSPLWVRQMMYVPIQAPIALGTGLALLSFRSVGRAMSQLSAHLECTTRGRFAQSSLGVSLTMFYVVALAVPLTALLLGTGHLPPTGMHLSALLGTAAPAPAVGQGFRYALAQALMFATMLSFIGCCFYIANRLRDNGLLQNPKEFDPLAFWSGLWFRLGQAMLYTFCVFIYIWGTDLNTTTDGLETVGIRFRMLPLIGLCIGMFVRAAEALVLGLADRTFHAVEQVVGPRRKQGEAKAITRAAPPLGETAGERLSDASAPRR